MTFYTFEYIWLDSENNARSKTKVSSLTSAPTSHTELPLWNYDGSSTGQAVTEKSEVELRPVKMIRDPFRNTDTSFLVLCETYNIDGTPHRDNTRSHAVTIFNMESTHLTPRFGLEQEFFISRQTAGGLVLQHFNQPNYPVQAITGVGGANILGRKYVEETLTSCILELPITGMNAEAS